MKRYASLLAAALVLVGLTLYSRADDETHGAAAPADQQAALEALSAHSEVKTTPPGVDPVLWGLMVPKDNQQNEVRVALGQKLYFDTRLSADGTVACSTCHDVSRGFTDQRPVSEGISGKLGRRNAPTTLNAALLGSQFWDGRAATLEEQAVLPIVNPIEMGHKSGADAVKAIAEDTAYKDMFQRAYGRAPNYEDIGRALAAFERTLIFLQSPFDSYTSGNTTGMSASAVAGWRLFNGKARCVACHPISIVNPMGTDNRFHNIGVSARDQDFYALAEKALETLGKDDTAEAVDKLALETDMNQLGRFLVTKSYEDMGAFRTSPLRNVGITGPYMHDGSMSTLWDVMDHYNKGGEPHAFLDGGVEPLALSDAEIDQVVDFLFALTDTRLATQGKAAREKQSAQSKKARPFKNVERAMRKEISFRPAEKKPAAEKPATAKEQDQPDVK